MERIVLAYSGGLDTSVAVPWLKETYGAEVITATLDLGQGRELDAVRERALAAGAVRAHVLDVREEFVHDYILPALQAGAIYEGGYPLATALGRPLIARKLVEIARIEGAGSIAHGCTGKGNDQVRIDVSARALEPAIRVIAPAREWGMTRPDEIEYARKRGVPVPVTQASPYSTDANLWGRSIECGVLEDPWVEPPEDVYTLTRDPAQCPDEAAYVQLDFERGVPVAVNGVPMAFIEIIGSVSTIAGAHGVGRIDMVENRLVGIKSREIYEAPAAVVIHMAHRELEGLVSAARLRAHQARPRPEVCRPGLQRPVVFAGPRGDRRLRRQVPGAGHRLGPPQALQGPLHGGRPRVALRALRARAGDLRRRRQVRSHRGGRFHQDLGTADRDGVAEVARRRPAGPLPARGLMAHLWSGRFDGAPDPDALAFGVSLHFDRRLFEDDITGSLAWAGALAEAGAITRADQEAIQRGLTAILDEGRRNPALVAGEDEDIHSFVERTLVERIGEAGKKLHTGRSRNEQVSLDLRLYLKRQIVVACHAVERLAAALLSQAEQNLRHTMPSYTHMRRAQPILVAHYFLSYVAALRRDHRRLLRARDEADEMPLGSGAIAGTSYAVDTAALARRLGFARVVANSLDAASDRDFVSSFLHASALAMMHLSRLAEDLILFSGEEFGFVELPDSLATGSSLMPQKKNPDPLELIRGKSGRLVGHLAGFLTTMKGLPAGYNRDLQEDKEPVFDAEATLRQSLEIMAVVVTGIRIDATRTGAASEGLLLATDVADYLVARGVPFRDAHGIVGSIVRRLIGEGRTFTDMTLAEWRSHSESFEPDIVGAITAAKSVAARRTPQSTAPFAVESAIEDAKKWLDGCSR